MPNHVTNIIESNDAKVISSMLDEKGFVDFRMIVPRHQDLEMNGANGFLLDAENAAKLMCQEKPNDNELVARIQMVNMLRASAIEMTDESFEQFVMMMRNKRRHGFYHMMDYATSAWGTKWNAYNQNPEKNTAQKVRFDTAWSHPFLVIKELSRKFPDDEIKIQFADEDLGSNCGSYKIKNGEVYDEGIAPSWRDSTPEQKKKFTKFAFELQNPDGDPRLWGYNSDWVYDETLEY